METLTNELIWDFIYAWMHFATSIIFTVFLSKEDESFLCFLFYCFLILWSSIAMFIRILQITIGILEYITTLHS